MQMKHPVHVCHPPTLSSTEITANVPFRPVPAICAIRPPG
jgi:hypothetical protein